MKVKCWNCLQIVIPIDADENGNILEYIQRGVEKDSNPHRYSLGIISRRNPHLKRIEIGNTAKKRRRSFRRSRMHPYRNDIFSENNDEGIGYCPNCGAKLIYE